TKRSDAPARETGAAEEGFLETVLRPFGPGLPESDGVAPDGTVLAEPPWDAAILTEALTGLFGAGVLRGFAGMAWALEALVRGPEAGWAARAGVGEDDRFMDSRLIHATPEAPPIPTVS
ncbi:MAG: hypothetical protein RLZZ34_1440, partial [Verrucomicrobiota bacterium]